jgi:hypothetical protein
VVFVHIPVFCMATFTVTPSNVRLVIGETRRFETVLFECADVSRDTGDRS